MAQVPYNPVAGAEPDARTPDDYQHVEANPSSFGGLIAQGAEKAGAGAVDMSKFWGHVQADDASNNAQKEASDLAEHIRTLQGQDALDAQQGAYKQLDTIYQKYRNQLSTPDQQLLFDNQNRPFFDRYVRGQMNTTFIDAGRQFATKTADAGIEVAHSMAATAGSDGAWPAVEVSYHKALAGEVKKLQIAGQANDPDAMAAAKDKAALVYKSGIEGMLQKNPDGAQAKLEDPAIKKALGANYAPLAKTVQEGVRLAYVSRADKMIVDDPMKVEDFVRSNEAKFGTSAGEMLERARRAKIDGAGKNLAAQSDAAVGSGAPPRTTLAADAAEGNKFLRGQERQHATGGNISEAEAVRIATGPATGQGVAPARAATVDDLFNAFHGQESGGGRNITTSIDNAHGDMQITPGTFAAYAKPGESIDNRADNIAVGKRILADYAARYNNDPARVAVAYFSGPGNVAPPGSATPWIANRRDGQGTLVSQYVNGILTRLGHPGVSGGPHPLSTSPRQGETLAVPGWQGATPASASDDIPSAAKTEPAAFTPPAPPAPPQTPEDIKNAIYEQESRRIRWVDAQDASIEEKEAAKRRIDQDTAFLLAASAEKQAAIKAREDAATDEVLGTARKAGYTAAYQKLNAFMQDPQRPLSEKQFDTLSDVLERRSGNPNPISYGSKYQEALNNIVKPKTEADRISDPREIMRLEADGQLTEKGTHSLLGALETMKKSTGEFGLQQRIAGASEYAKDYLDKSVNEPFMTIKDPEGKAKFEIEFLNMFHSELDTWRNAGKNVGDNPLLAPDHKALDQLLHSIRPRSKINEFQMQAGAMARFEPEPPGTPIPQAPETLNPSAWDKLMQAPPSIGGKPMPHEMWGKVLTALAADPRPAVVQSFNRYFGPGGFDGEKVVAALNAQHQRGNREEITPAESAAIQSHQEDRDFDRWLQSIPDWVVRRVREAGSPAAADEGRRLVGAHVPAPRDITEGTR